jgi:hypothetical protein
MWNRRFDQHNRNGGYLWRPEILAVWLEQSGLAIPRGVTFSRLLAR